MVYLINKYRTVDLKINTSMIKILIYFDISSYKTLIKNISRSQIHPEKNPHVVHLY